MRTDFLLLAAIVIGIVLFGKTRLQQGRRLEDKLDQIIQTISKDEKS